MFHSNKLHGVKSQKTIIVGVNSVVTARKCESTGKKSEFQGNWGLRMGIVLNGFGENVLRGTLLRFITRREMEVQLSANFSVRSKRRKTSGGKRSMFGRIRKDSKIDAFYIY